ncbi:MAG: flagellar basal body P-ring protein FlgI, partial [Candidatus Margulisbacteria bacterium]|nr:flagellar basal body P-ring protein FlgI [Candidatus Margulisiibacteriota bacterium]
KGQGIDASARDAGTVTIPVATTSNLVDLISRVENLKVIPDTIAKIVVNERTGTIVIGEKVRIAPVAVSYADIDVIIGDVSLFTEGSAAESAQDDARYRARSMARLKRTEGKLILVESGPTLSDLVRALNAVGATPKDMIAILQAMKKAGAIKAELEVI